MREIQCAVKEEEEGEVVRVRGAGGRAEGKGSY